MRMRKRMLALLAAALLLAGLLPVGALAAQDIPKEITTLVVAEVYRSDTDCIIDMEAWEALYGYVSWEDMENYSYDWRPLSPLDETEFYAYGGDIASYYCTKAEASKLKGKEISRCDVYDGKKKLTTITFKVGDVIYAPVTKNVPDPQYLYYTPDKPVTASVPAPSIGGGEKLHYQWYAYKGENDFEDYLDVNAPSITLTLGSEKDRWTLQAQAATMGYTNFKWLGSFILLNTEKKPVVMPNLSGDWMIFEMIDPGKSKTLTLPTATSGDPKKTVEYRWYTVDWDTGNRKLYKTTSTPQLTVTNTTDMHGKIIDYGCKAGYKGERESTFLEYGQVFNVEYLGTPSTPSKPASVPKTGDNTPLTALLLLLGVSLAGATLLVGMRRRQGHS